MGVFPSDGSSWPGIADRVKVIGRDIRVQCRFIELLVTVLVGILGIRGVHLTSER